MPFQYRLRKILEIRIRKKEEQLQVVLKAQEEVNRIELLIIENLEQIQKLNSEMKQADPMMYSWYDKYIKHLWDEDKKLNVQKQEAIEKTGVITDTILTPVNYYNAYFKTPEFFADDIRSELMKKGVNVMPA